MQFFIVDAFSTELFGGNPAGVVVIPEEADFPDDTVMLKTAAELRYSETAFVKKLGGRPEFEIRYFTPAAEVDLCGHATIGTFYALMHHGTLKEGEEALVHTKAGDINVLGKDGFVLMDMAEPKHISTISDAIEIDRLYDIMGSEFDQSLGLMPMIISTGLPDITLPVTNLAELNAMEPNFPALSKLSEAYGVTGVHAFCIETPAVAVTEPSSSPSAESAPSIKGELHARNFAPLYEIDEEAATGTANGALTFYLCLNEKIGTHDECRIIQGEKMGRPSEIRTTIHASETCKIQVGGKAAILAEGEIHL